MLRGIIKCFVGAFVLSGVVALVVCACLPHPINGFPVLLVLLLSDTFGIDDATGLILQSLIIAAVVTAIYAGYRHLLCDGADTPRRDRAK